jgi:hypothetical protein
MYDDMPIGENNLRRSWAGRPEGGLIEQEYYAGKAQGSHFSLLTQIVKYDRGIMTLDEFRASVSSVLNAWEGGNCGCSQCWEPPSAWQSILASVVGCSLDRENRILHTPWGDLKEGGVSKADEALQNLRKKLMYTDESEN